MARTAARRAAMSRSGADGSGKTLAAFLVCLDRLVREGLEGTLDDRNRAVYGLRSRPSATTSRRTAPSRKRRASRPNAASRCCRHLAPRCARAMTSAYERQQMLRRPPHILVTTPESLFKADRRARRAARTTQAVSVDDPRSRGRQTRRTLAPPLARLDDLVPKAGGAPAAHRPRHGAAHRTGGAVPRRARRVDARTWTAAIAGR